MHRQNTVYDSGCPCLTPIILLENLKFYTHTTCRILIDLRSYEHIFTRYSDFSKQEQMTFTYELVFFHYHSKGGQVIDGIVLFQRVNLFITPLITCLVHASSIPLYIKNSFVISEPTMISQQLLTLCTFPPLHKRLDQICTPNVSHAMLQCMIKHVISPCICYLPSHFSISTFM